MTDLLDYRAVWSVSPSELVVMLRSDGFPYKAIACATGLSEWTCRRIWRQHVELALDPVACLVYRDRMLDSLQAQLDTLRRSMFGQKAQRSSRYRNYHAHRHSKSSAPLLGDRAE